MRTTLKRFIVTLLVVALVVLPGCASLYDAVDGSHIQPGASSVSSDGTSSVETNSSVEEYLVLSDRPDFGVLDGFVGDLEQYGDLDLLGRCTPALVCLGLETVPTEGRGQIGHVMPTGYHSVQYDCVPGGWLYNRCHMVAFQLAGQNDNVQNLITGTKRMNTVMKRFEDAIRAYIVGTGNHVMYRVSPDFSGDDLVARGVRLEALSVEDGGTGISYDIYIPNVQDGVVIDYATGESWLEGESGSDVIANETMYVLNTNTKKFHRADCSSVASIKDKNRENSHQDRSALIAQGYDPCAVCNP